jgi:hypothetical protein
MSQEEQGQQEHEEEAQVGSQLENTSHHRKSRSQMRWPTNIKNVGQVNDEGFLVDKEISMRLSKVCALATQQRASLTLRDSMTWPKMCHTPFRDSGNEASIRVPRMFKSHV